MVNISLHALALAAGVFDEEPAAGLALGLTAVLVVVLVPDGFLAGIFKRY